MAPSGSQVVSQVCNREAAPFQSKEEEPQDGSDLTIVSEGCRFSLILCRWGFQDLLKISLSCLFMLCGCISSSSCPVILLVHMNYEDRKEYSATSAHKIQMPGNHPKERIHIHIMVKV